MRILLTGSTGMIGGRLLQHLSAAGHRVLCVGRRPPTELPPHCEWQKLQMDRASVGDWRPLLQGIDAVVQTVGIFRQTRRSSFRTLHVDAPARLFDACVQAGVARVLHVSALGADDGAQTAYHLSKRACDEHLLALPLQASVVQPSLVYSAGGASTQALLTLASLRWLVLPEGGHYSVQPIHIDDLCAAMLALLDLPATMQPQRVALVGPEALSLRSYLGALRHGLGRSPQQVLALPRWLTAVVAAVGSRLPGALFDRDAWRMLQRGNTAPAHDTATLLGHAPRPASAFVAANEAPALRMAADWRWLQPMLRISLALVWLWTAAVSLGLYPVAQSLQLLERSSVPPAWQLPALYGAALLDGLLGLATLHPGRHARRLWAAQAGLILGYTLFISWQLPEFWLHPYGPLSKNLPMLALLWLLWVREEPRAAHAANMR